MAFFKEDDGRPRKAIFEEMPLIIGANQVGKVGSVKWRKGKVKLGICERIQCDKLATMELLFGKQLCQGHVIEFYFGGKCAAPQHPQG